MTAPAPTRQTWLALALAAAGLVAVILLHHQGA